MKILAIGAHPDDIEIGCGGTLRLMFENGADITTYHATSGERGGDPRTRAREHVKAAVLYGAVCQRGRFKDSDIEESFRELIGKIEEKIARMSPDVIFVHSPNDTHQDHRALSRATITAARHNRSILFYEGFSTIDFRPTVNMDITGTFEKKMEMIRCYDSQLTKVVRGTDMNLLDAVKANAVYRGIHARTWYAESFSASRIMLNDIIFHDGPKGVNPAQVQKSVGDHG